MIKADLETLIGVKVRGDITVLVYELLKDSKEKRTLLDYEYLLMDKTLISKIEKGEELLNANNQTLPEHSSEESNHRPGFARWLAERGLSD